jgi:hypothetical protein
LLVSGSAEFQSSGVATVKKGDKTVTATAFAVTASNIVLATIQKPQSGVYIEAAEAGTGKVTITLNKAATADLPVGWFVVNRP